MFLFYILILVHYDNFLWQREGDAYMDFISNCAVLYFCKITTWHLDFSATRKQHLKLNVFEHFHLIPSVIHYYRWHSHMIIYTIVARIQIITCQSRMTTKLLWWRQGMMTGCQGVMSLFIVVSVFGNRNTKARSPLLKIEHHSIEVHVYEAL